MCVQVEPSGMPKIKSKSVSNETETCIVVIENSSLWPQEIWGELLESLVTFPWMHFDCDKH